jgi:tetratricopeptide (TPR) repeat protein
MPVSNSGPTRASGQALRKKIRLALEKADRQLQNSNLVGAEKSYQRILKQQPDQSEALQQLSIIKLQAGNFTAALHFMHKALNTAPDNPQLLKNIAGIYLQQGNLESTSNYATKALDLDSENVDALAIMGKVYYLQDQAEKAIELFGRVLTLNPDDVAAHHDLAKSVYSIGQYQSAKEHFQSVLSLDPDFDECRLNLANTLLKLKNYTLAENHYQQLNRRQPRNPGVLLGLAEAYELGGKIEAAIDCYQTILQGDSKFIQARLNLGKIYLPINPELSHHWFKSVLELDPKNAKAHYWHGVQLQSIGQFKQATTSFTQAIKLQPGFVEAWYRLSVNRNFKPDSQQIKTIEQHFESIARSQPESPDLIALGFTLGRIYEQLNDYDRAFTCFQKANRRKSRLYPFDKLAYDSQIDDLTRCFDIDFFNQRSDWGSRSDLPVFIVGMPRSGTTLVEQILGAHPQAHAAGELPFMQQLATSLDSANPVPATSHAGRFSALDQKQADQLAHQYLLKLQALEPTAHRVLDKQPGNFSRVGIIFTLFPAARIIHCKRNPMDTCLSCYQQNFDQGLSFANDLEDLGHAYRGYLRIMEHWQSLFPDRILDIEYESLIENSETESRRLLKFCDLEWDPGILDYKDRNQPVTSASLWQVRQAIYKSSMGRWKTYEKYMGPLIQELSTNAVSE